MLTAFHEVHAKHCSDESMLGKAVVAAQASVKQGLAADDLPAKCATQLHRIKRLLEASDWTKGATEPQGQKRERKKAERKSREVQAAGTNGISDKIEAPEKKRKKQKV
jgi:hypothetical protein